MSPLLRCVWIVIPAVCFGCSSAGDDGDADADQGALQGDGTGRPFDDRLACVTGEGVFEAVASRSAGQDLLEVQTPNFSATHYLGSSFVRVSYRNEARTVDVNAAIALDDVIAVKEARLRVGTNAKPDAVSISCKLVPGDGSKRREAENAAPVAPSTSAQLWCVTPEGQLAAEPGMSAGMRLLEVHSPSFSATHYLGNNDVRMTYGSPTRDVAFNGAVSLEEMNGKKVATIEVNGVKVACTLVGG